MKAFDEWWDSCNHKVPAYEDNFRWVWRTALKWAENQFVGKSAFEAEEAINKELRGT